MHNANGNVLFGSEKEIAKNKLISKIKSKPEAKLSQYESRLSTNKNKTKYYKINDYKLYMSDYIIKTKVVN